MSHTITCSRGRVLSTILALCFAAAAHAQIAYVDDDAPADGDGLSWATAYSDLQDALAHVATNGIVSEVRIAGGTYKPAQPGGPRTASFNLLNDVALLGGYAGYGATDPDAREISLYETILSGDLNGDDGPDFANNGDNSYHVVLADNVGPSAVLHGCTIVAGNADGSTTHAMGGGLSVSMANPTILDCAFSENSAGYGGALHAYSSSLMLADCTFTGNHATIDGGAVCYSSSTTPCLSNCRFFDNSANGNGGAIASNGGASKLTSCDIRLSHAAGNGGAISLASNSSMTLVNCLVANSRAGSGYGGAIWQTGDSGSTITNCTLVDNNAIYDGDSLALDAGCTSTISNTILYQHDNWNGHPDFYFQDKPPVINYSCFDSVSGMEEGKGNFYASPRFADRYGPDHVSGTGDEDYSLTLDSPCVDAGSNGLLPLDTDDLNTNGDVTEQLPLDIAGMPRVVYNPCATGAMTDTGPVVDMGAYETEQYNCFEVIGDPLAVPEGVTPADGDTSAFLVRLVLDPQESITAQIERMSGDEDLSIYDGSTLHFDSLNFDGLQAVSIVADEDADYTDGQATFRIRAPGIVSSSVTAVEQDNDPAPTRLYVDLDATGDNSGTSWANALTSLQEALRVADQTNGRVEEVWVASGRYLPEPDADRQDPAFALPAACAVYGGFAGWETSLEQRVWTAYLTTLSGDIARNDVANLAGGVACMNTQSEVLSSACRVFDIDGDDDVDAEDLGIDENCCSVVDASYTEEASRLDGFVITGGSGDHCSGGGLNNEGGNLTIANCIFRANFDWSDGGAIDIDSASPTISNCTFDRNRSAWNDGGAISIDYQSDLLVQNCIFKDNYANVGASICNFDSKLTAVGCRFIGNQASPTGGGGIASYDSNTVITNCAFMGNRSANSGACARQVGSTATITNSVFYSNSTTYGSGAVYASSSTVGVNNCIFWSNAGSGTAEVNQIRQYNSDLSVTHCCVQGLNQYAGDGNIDRDPRFADPAGPDNVTGTLDDDLRLTSLSPCIDAGSNLIDIDISADGVQSLPDQDLAGKPRFVDDVMVPDTGTGSPPVVDMGPFEYQADCNNNGVDDQIDVALGTSEDCNSNSAPDECDIMLADCNGNGIPDDCELDDNDCNTDGTPDDCELSENDCNENAVPDECELDGNDCNANDTPDDCELFENDCNENSVPDDCEIALLLNESGQPAGQMVCSNGVATFTVVSDVEDVTYQWYSQDSGLPLAEIAGKIEGVDSATLTIMDVEDYDGGTYFCRLMDGCVERHSNSVELLVDGVPNITDVSDNFSCCENSSAAITVAHEGQGVFSYDYTWTKDGVEISPQSNLPILQLANVSVRDSGVYSCCVRSRRCGATACSTGITVDVIGAVFLEQPATQCHQSGETAVFDMAVEYENPISGYVWQRWYGDPYNRWINVAAPAAGDVQPLEVTASADTLYRGGVYLDNACWSYSNPATLYVGNATGDLDGDGDIDLMDMAKFTQCFGLDSDTEPKCTCADFDWANTVINLNDWSQMETEVTGP